MVDIAIFSRRLDALENYLQRLRSLGRATESEYVAAPEIHDLAALRRWALGKLDADRI